MTENLRHQQEEFIAPTSNEHVQETPNKHELESNKPEKSYSREDIERVREDIEQHSVARESVKNRHETNKEDSHQTHYITNKLKSDRYVQSLASIRQQLPKTSRLFSKVIHQTKIETISEYASKTIARPSGIIGGGLIGFLASLSIFIIAKTAGFVLPSSIFVILFCAGYLLGVIAELMIRLITKTKK